MNDELLSPEKKNPDQLRLWTFYNPNDGPAVLEANGVTFHCESVNVTNTAPDMEVLQPYGPYIETTDWEVEVTFKLVIPSNRRPDHVYYDTRLHPSHIRL